MKRKTLLFLFIVISSSQITNAQITKGSFFLGGSVGFSTYKGDADLVDMDQKRTTYDFSPAFGKVVKDNLVVGGEMILGGYKVENNISTWDDRIQAGAGVFVRKYFPVINKLYLFAHGRFGVAYVREEYKQPSTYTYSRGYTIGVGVNPGISYAITPKFHIETSLSSLVSLSLAHRNTEYSNDQYVVNTKSNEFSMSSNAFSQTGLYIGIRFFWPGK